MQWRFGTRPTARFLPPVLSELIVHYLIYVPPLIRFFHHCVQSPIPRPFLFIEEGDLPWEP